MHPTVALSDCPGRTRLQMRRRTLSLRRHAVLRRGGRPSVFVTSSAIQCSTLHNDRGTSASKTHLAHRHSKSNCLKTVCRASKLSLVFTYEMVSSSPRRMSRVASHQSHRPASVLLSPWCEATRDILRGEEL